MKYVVITGCLGLLGKHLTRKCLRKGWKVWGIDKCNYCADLSILEHFESYNSNESKKFIFWEEDIKDLKRLPRCDYVINCAAESHVANSIDDSIPFIESNVSGVQNLLELIRKHGDNRRPILLHLSTDETYGDISDGEFTENSLLNPSNPYSASKASGDMFILSYARTHGVKYNILRPTNFYGIGQYPEKLIPLAIENLDRGMKIPLHNNGTPIRTWLHVEDACDAIFTILEKGKRNEIYNCSGGFEQTNRKTVEKIIESYYEGDKEAFEESVDFSYDRRGQDIRYALDDSKLRSLGWKPTKNFDDEIVKIVKYHKGRSIW